jgi:sortase A
MVMPAPPVKPALAVTPSRPRVAVPDRLELPAIGLDIPVVELGWHPAEADSGASLSEWDEAEYAAGWHRNSARLGEAGNVVMSGHNNILGAVFRQLDQLREGDEAVVWAGNEKVVYRVDKVFIVPEQDATPAQRAENAKWIGPFDDDRLTLVSCWPRNNNTHRIVVVARPIEGLVVR